MFRLKLIFGNKRLRSPTGSNTIKSVISDEILSTLLHLFQPNIPTGPRVQTLASDLSNHFAVSSIQHLGPRQHPVYRLMNNSVCWSFASLQRRNYWTTNQQTANLCHLWGLCRICGFIFCSAKRHYDSEPNLIPRHVWTTKSRFI